MRQLGPDRVGEDGTYLVARDPGTGETFALSIDDRLRRLIDLADQRTRSGRRDGQLEITMESTLSPREIQSRIRRGESPQTVADSAGVPVEQIAGFAAPVMAERAYLAEQARTTPLRRKHVGGSPVALGAIVDEHVSELGGVPEAAVWDAWRREDGRWTVQVTPEGADPATFLFDVKSRYVLPADEAAHGLVGDVAHPDESSDMALADAVRPDTVRRATSTEPVLTAEQVVAEDLGLHAPVTSLKEARDRRAMEQMALTDLEEEPADPPVDPLPRQTSRTSEPQEQLPEESATPARDEPVAPERPVEEPVEKRKHERRRVPSWDEIMFGGKDA